MAKKKQEDQPDWKPRNLDEQNDSEIFDQYTAQWFGDSQENDQDVKQEDDNSKKDSRN